MKKKVFFHLLPILMLVFIVFSCKKEYITGGVPEDVNMYKEMTTYDVLKTMPLYDTLIILIDAAGLKDNINKDNVSFFAPSDYSIFSYLNLQTIRVQNFDASSKFALDSILYYIKNNVKGTRDSLKMYIINQMLPFSKLTNTGAYYPTELPNHSVIISYEYTLDRNSGYNPVVSSTPQLIYFTHLWYPYNLNDANPAGKISAAIGVHTLVKTAGIVTKTGMIHSLENSHNLFFYNTKK